MYVHRLFSDLDKDNFKMWKEDRFDRIHCSDRVVVCVLFLIIVCEGKPRQVYAENYE